MECVVCVCETKGASAKSHVGAGEFRQLPPGHVSDATRHAADHTHCMLVPSNLPSALGRLVRRVARRRSRNVDADRAGGARGSHDGQRQCGARDHQRSVWCGTLRTGWRRAAGRCRAQSETARRLSKQHGMWRSKALKKIWGSFGAESAQSRCICLIVFTFCIFLTTEWSTC